MILFSAVILLHTLSAVQPIVVNRNFQKDELEQQQWVSYKTQFNKMYDSKDEDYKRMKIYLDNAVKITKHNELFEKGEVSFNMALNEFSDLTLEEFSQLYSSQLEVDSITNDLNDTPMKSLANFTAPKEKNWVQQGAVTRVKDQGFCRSCWAFITAAAIESHLAISSGQLIDLSTQNLLDCTGWSCSGGNEIDAFKYVLKNGIESEKDYPYEMTKNSCHYNQQKVVARIKNYESASTHRDERILKEVVGNIGPVTSAIHSKSFEFMHYNSGILKTKACSNKPSDADHGVLVVGYGANKRGKEYWLVKNSWGVNWGEKGYARIARNTNNTCGIARRNYYPII